MRKIIHVDMDAFYASVEQRDRPELRGRPVVVGGDPAGRGVVAAASYEARRFGIHSAMPAARAARACPEVVFLRPRFDVYRAVSRQIHEVFRRYTERIEPLSLDEAYLDVSDSPACRGSATLMAREIKAAIRETTGLVASAGVSYNKFLAKLASDVDKPDGLYLIDPEAAPGFIQDLPVGDFHGVGPATERRMKARGIHTGGDLRRHELHELVEWFGKAGRHYYQIARGIDERPVQSRRERKSLGHETTYPNDLVGREAVEAALPPLAERVARDLAARELVACTVTLKVKYADFVQITRRRTFTRPLSSAGELLGALPGLLDDTEAGRRPIRLLGVTCSGLEAREEQPLGELDLGWPSAGSR
ncbi:DNA polymerase IV [Guyparkeria halophila]|uniref:DNA polymerase IV n=1 Tax=Guyparkeria halophila TaxID=47960 RepID=A0A6I6D1B6_9GAMM|nr:DNA polymerase IV [Guyparkeria halophila]QGT77524.1 DNA polymerase IV [Guyparkeria halophila]